MTAEQAEAELLARLIEYRRYAAAAALAGRGGRLGAARVPGRAGAARAAARARGRGVLGGSVAAPRPPSAGCCSRRPRSTCSAVRRRLVPVSEFLDRFRARAPRAAGVRRSTRRSPDSTGCRMRPRSWPCSRCGSRARCRPSRARCSGRSGSLGAGGRGPSRSAPSHERAHAHRRGAAVRRLRAAQRAPSSRPWPRRRRPGSSGPSTPSRDHYCEERSGVVLERVAGGYGFRASRETAAACARLVNRAQLARAQPGCARDAGDRRLPGPGLAARDRPHPRRRGRLGGRRPARARPDRGVRPRRDAGTARALQDHDAVRAACSASRRGWRACPALGEFDLPEADHEALRARLHLVADPRAGQG